MSKLPIETVSMGTVYFCPHCNSRNKYMEMAVACRDKCHDAEVEVKEDHELQKSEFLKEKAERERLKELEEAESELLNEVFGGVASIHDELILKESKDVR